MNDLESKLIALLCTGLGEGNSNTDKLTKEILKFNPDLDYNNIKIKVVDALESLISKGHIQMMTVQWEFGEEFLYICSKRL